MTIQTSTEAQLYIGTVDIGTITNLTLDIARDVLETTGIGRRDRTYIPGMRSATGSGTLYYDSSDSGVTTIMNHILNDDESLLGIRLAFANDTIISGNAVISSVGPAVSVGAVTTVSIAFTFSGKLAGTF